MKWKNNVVIIGLIGFIFLILAKNMLDSSVDQPINMVEVNDLLQTLENLDGSEQINERLQELSFLEDYSL